MERWERLLQKVEQIVDRLDAMTVKAAPQADLAGRLDGVGV